MLHPFYYKIIFYKIPQDILLKDFNSGTPIRADWEHSFYDDVLSGKTEYYSNLIPEQME